MLSGDVNIKGEGGMVMAQTPESTEYHGMPSSAIATGLVDYVLPPAKMPEQLIAYATHAFSPNRSHLPQQPSNKEDSLKKIFILLRAQTGHDFSQYKKNTINRRIERRMAVQQIVAIEDYVNFSRSNPAEVDALFGDLLIGVTSFFRDPEAFKVLEKTVIPQLFAGKRDGGIIRVWVPGCSTGEEAYSIAILLQEYMEKIKKTFKIQVFATDIDSRAINHARQGIYSGAITADVDDIRLARFFTQDGTNREYRVNKNLRDLLIFSEQNVIKDPPFSRIDLLSCRNLMIYLGSSLQKRLLPLFHYALNRDGKLFLGTSETVGDYIDLFAAIDRKAKIFNVKEDVQRLHHPGIGRLFPLFTERNPDMLANEKAEVIVPCKLSELVEKTLLMHFSPVAALVNDKGDILYLHGRTGKYLEPAPGEAGLNVLKMAREGLRRVLTTDFHKVVRTSQILVESGLRVKTNGSFTTINLTIRPVVADQKIGAPLYLIIFEERENENLEHRTVEDAKDDSKDVKSTEGDQQVKDLKQELLLKEEYLQTTVEELETSNEELKSSNEEMQSVNEELQSTNEELETSKEELQSVNEELATVNAELQSKVNDLSRINNDMNNLLAGTGIGTIFVDHKLCILRFTPAVTQVINLIPSDIGRPISHIVSKLDGYNSLVPDLKDVLNTLIPKEIEVKTTQGAWYIMRIRPYRTVDNVIEGGVLTFTEITESRKAAEALREWDSINRLAAVVNDSHDAVIALDMKGQIKAWNPAAERMYGWTEAAALSKNIGELIPESAMLDGLKKITTLRKANVLKPYHTQRKTKNGMIVDVWLTATELIKSSGEVYAIAITERLFQGNNEVNDGKE